MNIAQFIAGGWKEELSTDLKEKEVIAEEMKNRAEDETSEDKAIADAYVDESLCECGEPLDEKEELCPECEASRVESHQDL